ncbi:hypothetical protein BpHYR1_000430 [Brachionus plicatilis]|uniref:Uncharacterized protein n=1 Tax=Brachionus plicatilis TaxID=10195 RepID=A0A3M7Q4L5_BRAPC|nr:hypothetical protein BpHYR1_000430 [Brachionus plicatilis]
MILNTVSRTRVIRTLCPQEMCLQVTVIQMSEKKRKTQKGFAVKAKYLERTNHTMESQERLIAHIERRFREEQEGRRDAEARLRQAEVELDKAKKTIRQLEDTVKSLHEVLEGEENEVIVVTIDTVCNFIGHLLLKSPIIRQNYHD